MFVVQYFLSGNCRTFSNLYTPALSEQEILPLEQSNQLWPYAPPGVIEHALGWSKDDFVNCVFIFCPLLDCSEQKVFARSAARQFRRLKWWCELEKTSIIWSVSLASDVIRDSVLGTSFICSTTESFASMITKRWCLMENQILKDLLSS